MPDQAVDVVFVNPGAPNQIYQTLGDEFSAIEPPAFAGLFATYLRRRGHGVTIVDAPAAGLTPEAVAQLVAEDMSATLVVIAVYGFQPSASTQNMTSAGRIARAIKALDPKLPILMTGTHLAALPERSLLEEAVDFVCDREGPITIEKTLLALKAGLEDFSDIPSLWWRRDGVVQAPASSEAVLRTLSADMPGIAWDLMDMSLYRAHNWHAFDHIHERSPYAAIHTSVGCPFKCSFCCINAPYGKPTYRMWEVDTVVDEIERLATVHGVRNIKFIDEMFVLNKRHVLGICDGILERKLDVNIWAYARVDTVEDESLLARMKAAGINWLALGIEAASTDVRDGADKVYGNAEITAAVRRLQKHGLYVLGNYIFGLPHDTYDSMRQTLDLALELNCEFANIYSAMAYPGSRLYAQAQAEGRTLPREWHHFSQHAYESTPLANDHLSAAQILGFRDHAWDRYFQNPAYLDLLGRRFGDDVVSHVRRMTGTSLKRKLLEDHPDAVMALETLMIPD